MTILTDRPIANRTEDRLERARLAELLARRLARHESDIALTVGICGAWGSGKTSFLNLMTEQLSAPQPDGRTVVVVGLSTWVLAQEPNLAARLLAEIAAQLHQKSTMAQVGKAARGMAQLAVRALPWALAGAELAGLPWAGLAKGVATVVAEGVQTDKEAEAPPSLESLQKEVSEALRSSKQLLVVKLDDLDRLPDDRIQEVFRLIAVLGNFANTVYLVALDRDRVADALTNSGFGDGQAYLEKVLTVVYDLPEPSPEALHHAFLDAVQSALAPYEFGPDIERTRTFYQAWQRALRHLIRHPRDIPRVVNGYSLALEAVHEQTHPVDLLCVETLRVLDPDLYRLVARRGRAFLDNHSLEELTADIADAENHSSNVDRSRNEHMVRYLLELCTPQIISEGGSRAAALHRSRRLAAPEFFDAYFRWTLGPLEWTDSGMWGALDGLLSAGNDESIREWADTVADRLPHWLFKIANYPEAIAERPNSVTICARILQMSQCVPGAFALIPPSVDVAAELVGAIRRIQCPKYQVLMHASEVRPDIQQWMHDLLDAHGESTLSIGLLNQLVRDCGPDRRTSLSEEVRGRGSEIAARAFGSGTLDGHLWEFDMFVAWREVAPSSDTGPHDYLVNSLRDGPDRLWRIVSVPMRRRSEDDGPATIAERILRVLDPALLADLLVLLPTNDERHAPVAEIKQHLEEVRIPAGARRAIVRDRVCKVFLDSGGPADGRLIRANVRLASTGAVTDTALRLLQDEGHIAMHGERPREIYRPSARGMLASTYAPVVRSIVAKALDLWREQPDDDRDLAFLGWAELQPLLPEVSEQWAQVVLNLFGLVGPGRGGDGTVPAIGFCYWPPTDLDDCLKAKDLEAFLTWRAGGAP